MPGPPPARNRRRRNVPALGEWQSTPGVGWHHGPIPDPPDGLVAASRDTWQTWFRAWFAAHWTPDDLPGLGIVISQYDNVQRGATKAADWTALLRAMDTYGITPAGQQARRWAAPEPDQEKDKPVQATDAAGQYGHLRVAK